MTHIQIPSLLVTLFETLRIIIFLSIILPILKNLLCFRPFSVWLAFCLIKLHLYSFYCSIIVPWVVYFQFQVRLFHCSICFIFQTNQDLIHGSTHLLIVDLVSQILSLFSQIALSLSHKVLTPTHFSSFLIIVPVQHMIFPSISSF